MLSGMISVRFKIMNIAESPLFLIQE